MVTWLQQTCSCRPVNPGAAVRGIALHYACLFEDESYAWHLILSGAFDDVIDSAIVPISHIAAMLGHMRVLG